MNHEHLQNDSATAIKTRLFLLHASCLSALLFPVTEPLLWLALISFVLRMFGVEGAYHRYFAHRSYQCHPALQVVYLLFGAAAFQNSAAVWASLCALSGTNESQNTRKIGHA